jgi:hypothetical protein
MKISSIPVVAVGAALMSTGLALASDSNAKVGVPAAPAAENAGSGRTPPALEAGMTAEAVQRVVGKPAEIKPIEAPEGKAETWIYRRQIGKQTTLESTPGNSGSSALVEGALATAAPIEYRTKTTTSYQVTSLLMFDGKLIKAKQSVSQVVSYDR